MIAAQEATSGLSQAALMVLLLEEDVASSLLAGLSPPELRKLAQEMASLEEVEPGQIASAIAAFAHGAEPKPIAGKPGSAQIRNLFEGAVGPMKADGLLRNLGTKDRAAADGPLALLRWLAPEAVLTLVAGEHPQVIAVLLLQLEAETAAQILAGLAKEMQSDIVHRIATLEALPPEALGLLGELVERRIGDIYGTLPLAVGGVGEAAEIINQAARSVEKQVMPALNKRDKAVARKMEEAMFRFDHLYELDAQAMGKLLREVDSDILIDALKGVDDEQREVFFRAMSSRAADGVRDEIEARGRMKLADVEKAQREMVGVARKLAAEGTIIFGPGEDDYV